MSKYDTIMGAEEQFAREVALRVIYLKPQTAWYYLIPGMFIFDFLRRGSIIRKYTETFMFPRKLALEAARSLGANQSRTAIDPHLDSEIKTWLTAHHLESQDLALAQKATVDLLVAHYARLLQSEGQTYYDLIENAYPSREDFEDHLRQITAAENKVDQAILERVGDKPEILQKLQLEAQQVQNRRQKILEDIF